MQLFDPNNPNEKKKMIAAAVLGLGAIIVLGYVFFGGSSAKPGTNSPPVVRGPSPTPGKIVRDDTVAEDSSVFQSIRFTDTHPAVSEADRNIFAYYEPPPPVVKPPYIPTPTPAPTPPLTISSMTPNNVYAGTPADFSLQVMGDKLTPALHITIDGRDLPSRFVSAQQMTTTVPATLIANPGQRLVMVRGNDPNLYTNSLTLTVTPAPVPNYNYIGLLGKPHFNDTAVLQDKGTKDLFNVQRGELIGGQNGRFRVTSISEREVKVIDTVLKIKHTISYTVDPATGQPFRPPVRTTDDEPR